MEQGTEEEKQLQRDYWADAHVAGGEIDMKMKRVSGSKTMFQVLKKSAPDRLELDQKDLHAESPPQVARKYRWARTLINILAVTVVSTACC